MKRIGTLGALAACLTFALAGLVWSAPPASAATPGGVFVTGHDPDFHAGTLGARNIIQRAVAYVTYGKAKPRMLLVTGVINPGPEYIDPRNGMRASGFTFDVADHGSGTKGILDFRTVNFSTYDVIVVASDFGGWLRQAELDVLKQRSGDLIDFVNNGGGLVAFAESGGPRALTTHDRFSYLPFVVSELPRDQQEVGFKVTPAGAAMGLADSDVNGNYSHNIFSEAGGLNVIDNDAGGNPMALAARGLFVSPEGVPALSIDDVTVTENVLGDGTATFTVSISIPIPATVTVDYATSDGTAKAPDDYTETKGTLTFQPNQKVATITVPIKSDLAVEQDETFKVTLSNPTAANIEDGEGIGTIKDPLPLAPPSTPVNHPPVCTGVTAGPSSLSPADHVFELVKLSGATDADGDTLTYDILGVTQDEPLVGTSPDDASPDARRVDATDTVELRRERADAGDGRLYTIVFTVSDGKGGKCMGRTTVGVAKDGGGGPTDSGLDINSFDFIQQQAAQGPQVLPLQLPRTGMPIRALALAGAALVGCGALLLATLRRRRARA
jgi:hypothetical protein